MFAFWSFLPAPPAPTARTQQTEPQPATSKSASEDRELHILPNYFGGPPVSDGRTYSVAMISVYAKQIPPRTQLFVQGKIVNFVLGMVVLEDEQNPAARLGCFPETANDYDDVRYLYPVGKSVQAAGEYGGSPQNAVFQGHPLLRNCYVSGPTEVSKVVQPVSVHELLPRPQFATEGSDGVIAKNDSTPARDVSVSENGHPASVEVGSLNPQGLAEDTEVFKIGGEVSAPKKLYDPDPDYPKEALQSKLQGTCSLELIVGADGKPRDIEVTHKLGSGLDEKAIEAVKSWRFEPAMKNGKPVAVRILVSINFHILNQPGGPHLP